MIKDYGREIPEDYSGPTWDTQSLQDDFDVNYVSTLTARATSPR